MTSSNATISFAAQTAAAYVVVQVETAGLGDEHAGTRVLFTIDSATTPLLWLAEFKDGSLHAYTPKWLCCAGCVPVPMNAWSTVTLQRTGTCGTLQINNGEPDSVPPYSTAATVGR